MQQLLYLQWLELLHEQGCLQQLREYFVLASVRVRKSPPEYEANKTEEGSITSDCQCYKGQARTTVMSNVYVSLTQIFSVDIHKLA